MSTTATTSNPAAPSYRWGTRVTNALNGGYLFNLFDDAVADLCCLRTYTHGTSPKCYNSIMKIGADPSHGGKGGECGLYEAFGARHHEEEVGDGESTEWQCGKRFFVFVPESFVLVKRWMPRVYSIVACTGENCSVRQNKLIKAFWIVASIFEGFCSPTLKFHFRTDRPTKFELDQTFNSKFAIAGFTQQPIAADHIGLYGCFSEGVNSQWKDRIKSNPKQFAKGLLELVAIVSIIVLIVFAANHSSIAKTIVQVYVIVKTAQIMCRFFVPLFYNLKK